jgi:Domain of unknown function (DUF4168)
LQPTRQSLVAWGVAALLLLASPQAIAQDEPAASDFSQQQIEAFADAAVEVQRVRTELSAQAGKAAGPDEVARLQQQASAEAAQAVADSGLTVDQYSAIVQAANADPELYAMIVDLMEERSPR